MREPESQIPSDVPGKLPPIPEVLVWAITPSFTQRTVSPTEIERFTGLKNPTQRPPVHRLSSPTDTTRVVGALVVLVVLVLVDVLEVDVLVLEEVEPGDVVVLDGLDVEVVLSATVVELLVEEVVVPGAGPPVVVVTSSVVDV